jgi:preprotein translocase subunit SecF
VVDLTMSRPAYQQQAERVAARRDKLARKVAATNPDSEGEISSAAADSTSTGDALTAAAVPTAVGKTAPGGRRRGHGGSKNSRPSGKAGRSSRR